MRTIFELLAREHREIADLLDHVQNASPDEIDDAKDLFAVVEEKLLAHARGEEAVVYPRLAAIDALREPIADARDAHGVVETLLARLEADDLDDDDWLASARLLQEEVEQHVDDEEQGIFAIARDELDDDDASQLARRYLAVREEMIEGRAAAVSASP